MSELLERVKSLAAVWGPSGREQRVAALLEELITPYVDQIRHDGFGNLIATRQGQEGGPVVLLAAHMDTPGAMALNVSEKGLIYLAPVGGLKAEHAIGQRAVWGSGAVGVIQREYAEEAKELDFKRLFCDIGATSKEEALASVALGDICTLVADLQLMADAVVAPGLDNRGGCAVLLEVAEHLAGSDSTVHFAFLSQGEVAPRGGSVASYSTRPDLAFVVDTALAGDQPRAPRVGTRLGAGPALRLKDSSYMAHHGLATRVQEVAEAQAIPLQLEIGVAASEGQVVSVSGPGVPTVVIDLPIRYQGTAGEMVNLRDLHGAADLLLKLLVGPLELR